MVCRLAVKRLPCQIGAGHPRLAPRQTYLRLTLQRQGRLVHLRQIRAPQSGYRYRVNALVDPVAVTASVKNHCPAESILRYLVPEPQQMTGVMFTGLPASLELKSEQLPSALGHQVDLALAVPRSQVVQGNRSFGNIRLHPQLGGRERIKEAPAQIVIAVDVVQVNPATAAAKPGSTK